MFIFYRSNKYTSICRHTIYTTRIRDLFKGGFSNHFRFFWIADIQENK